MEYLILFIIIFIPVINYDIISNNEGKNWYYIFEWFAIVFLMGFRYHVGGDSFSYEDAYESYPTLSNIGNYSYDTTRYAVLWDLFCIVCKSISKEFFCFQLIHVSLLNFVVFRFFKRHTRYYFSAVFLYALLFLFKYNTEVLRASLAVAVFLFSFDYLKNKQWIKYYACCAIAIGFHVEAFVLLLFPVIHLINKIRISIFSLLIFFVIVYFLAFSFSFMPFLSDFFANDENISTSLELYGGLVEHHLNAVGYLYHLAIYCGYIVILLYLRRNVNDCLNPLLLFYIFFKMLSLNMSHIAGRIEDFLIPILILFVVSSYEILSSLVVKKRIILNFCLFILIVTFMQNSIRIAPLVYPYSSIFYPEDVPGRRALYEIMVNSDR